jgi:hypothetical protein
MERGRKFQTWRKYKTLVSEVGKTPTGHVGSYFLETQH